MMILTCPLVHKGNYVYQRQGRFLWIFDILHWSEEEKRILSKTLRNNRAQKNIYSKGRISYFKPWYLYG